MKNHIDDKGLTSRIYILKRVKEQQSNRKSAKDVYKYAKVHKMTNKHIKRCSTSLTIMEMQTKTMIGYYHIPIRMGKDFFFLILQD